MAKKGQPINDLKDDDTGIPDGDGTEADVRTGHEDLGEETGLDAAPDGDENPDGDDGEAEDLEGKPEEEQEGADEPDASERSEDRPPRTGDPVKAIRALRAENKRMRAEWAQREEAIRQQSIADAERRLSLIVDAVKRRTQEQPAQEAPKPPPDPATDPAGFLKWQSEMYNADRSRFEQAIEQQNQQIEWQRTQQYAAQIDQIGVAEHPDFKAAVGHVVRDWYEDALAAGMDPQQADQSARGNLLGFIQQAAQRNIPAHTALYQRALKKGFQAQPARPAQTAQTRIDGVRAAKQAPGTKSASAIPGKVAPRQGKMTPGDLLGMKDSDFAQLDDREWYDSLFNS